MSCVVFAYSQLGYECLKFLIDQGHGVLALYTHEDLPTEFQWFQSCADLARKHHIPVFTPSDLNKETVLQIQSLNPRLIFSFYYRKIIPEEILNLPPRGAFNMHGSYLPHYRGRAPLNWAIIHGETKTGVTLHHMILEPDAGDVVDQKMVPISPSACAGEVMADMTQAAVSILSRQINNLEKGLAPRMPQSHEHATYFGGRTANDGQVFWEKTSKEIHNLIRALLPYPQYPGAFGFLNGQKFIFTHSKPYLGDFPPCNPGTITKDMFPVFEVSCGQHGVERVQVTVL